MITKILITLLVIVGAWILVKRQRQAPRQQTQASKTTLSKKTGNSDIQWQTSDLRIGAYMFIAIMFLLGSYLYYQRWQNDHQLLSIKLYQAGNPQAVEYQVFRYQLNRRSFVTTDGVLVDIADNERMEIIGLTDK